MPDGYTPQRLNRYVYCRNNPLIYTDPTGHYDPDIGPGNHTTLENQAKDIVNRIETGRGFAVYDGGVGPNTTKEEIKSLAEFYNREVRLANFDSSTTQAKIRDFMKGANEKLTDMGEAPLAPPGVDLLDNLMQQKIGIVGLIGFYNKVKPGGDWDYKQKGIEYEDFGNFNFGATGKALGVDLETLERGAGFVQENAMPEWGDWYGGPPYGDDPRDQKMIENGYNYNWDL